MSLVKTTIDRSEIRLSCRVVGLLLLGAGGLLDLLQAIIAVAHGPSVEGGRALDVQQQTANSYFLIAVSALVLVLLIVGGIGRRAGLVLSAAPAKAHLGTVLVVIAAMTLGGLIPWHLGLQTASEGSVADTWGNLDLGVRGLMAARAGLSEETFDLLAPVAVAVASVELVQHLRGSVSTGRTPAVWFGAAAGVLFLGVRVAGHLYQGSGAIVRVLIWGGVFLALYLLFRTFWAVAIGHAIFDFAVAGSGINLPGMWCLAVGCGGIGVVLLFVAWRSTHPEAIWEATRWT